MPIKRVFLGWNRPALAAAADYLVDRYRRPTAVDLSRVIVAVPGGRAGRRLEELLLERAEAVGLTLSPPSLITVGQLSEKLYAAQRPFADRLTQQLAWGEALARTADGVLAELVREMPSETDLAGRLALGEMLARLHRELAGDGLDFAQVAACGARLDEFPEQARWEALATVQQSYLNFLDSLELWDLQTARLYAIRYRECHTDCDVILVGTADLNRVQRQILDLVSEWVTALVFAPEGLAERFDSHGCLCVPAWQDVPLDLREEQLEFVDGPTDQALAVARALAGCGGRYGAHEITIGVPSEPLIPYVQQQLEQCGVKTRHGAGVPVGRTSPYRLLSAVAGYLETGSFASLAALVRHPAIDEWLGRQGLAGDWLSQLDRYRGRHLPVTVDGTWRGDGKDYDAIEAACAKIHQLLESTLGWVGDGRRSGPRRRLSQWGQPVLALLTAVFGGRRLRRNEEPDRTHWLACQKLFDVVSANLPLGRYDGLEPELGGAEALRLILRQAEGETIAPPADPDAVELLGWLELPLDDAPVLVVCGMNDQTIPESLSADHILPDHMRRQLGVEDNDRRYARDLYALSVLAASRQELKLIAGRWSPEGNPLTPSRLFFACDPDTIARRVVACFGEDRQGPAVAVPRGALVPGRAKTSLMPPRPEPLEKPVESMRVTEFRDYLACPYRYYLKHRLRLEGLSDSGEELDAAGFGSLAHEVLGDFGTSQAAPSTNDQEIAAYLNDSLDRHARRFFGNSPLPAVRVQIEQLRWRLMHFARWQAEWASQGWRIVAVERELEGASLVVDGQALSLRGRIDRIDVNQLTGERVIFDHKTGDTARRPEQTHLTKGEWVDLQLPLYHHMVSEADGGGSLRVGYIVLPKDTTRIGPLLAPWGEAELAEAGRVAQEVVRKIRSAKFWPPTLPPPAFSEEFAAICQDGQFGALADALREEGGES
ncbi:MAG: PD-(D/E)XK nuclease family protein [Thermoguttaceae bacterium]